MKMKSFNKTISELYTDKSSLTSQSIKRFDKSFDAKHVYVEMRKQIKTKPNSVSPSQKRNLTEPSSGKSGTSSLRSGSES